MQGCRRGPPKSTILSCPAQLELKSIKKAITTVMIAEFCNWGRKYCTALLLFSSIKLM